MGRYRLFCGGEALVGSGEWTNQRETFVDHLGCLWALFIVSNQGLTFQRAISGSFHRQSVIVLHSEGELMSNFFRISVEFPFKCLVRTAISWTG